MYDKPYDECEELAWTEIRVITPMEVLPIREEDEEFYQSMIEEEQEDFERETRMDKPYEEIKKLSTADIIHLMIKNFDLHQMDNFLEDVYYQNSVYVNCYEVLEDRFKKIDEAL